MAARKRTLTEALTETAALNASRTRARKRVARAKREAMAPRPPDAAVMAYRNALANYAARVEVLTERHVLSKLPVLGSGDPLDLQALEAGIGELTDALGQLSHTIRRSARAAGRRTLDHTRREVSRMMRMVVPDDARSEFELEAFVNRQVLRLQKVATDQVHLIRKAITEYQEGTSMRESILHTLWVSRNRGQLIARTEPYKLAQATVRSWSLAVGSEGGYYCTRRDELVRPSHAAHDGKYYRWSETPSTLGEPNCRCRMIPAEAFEE